MAKFKRRTKGQTTQWPNLNKEGQRDKFKRRRTKGRTQEGQWPNLNKEGQRDGQHNGQI